MEITITVTEPNTPGASGWAIKRNSYIILAGAWQGTTRATLLQATTTLQIWTEDIANRHV